MENEHEEILLSETKLISDAVNRELNDNNEKSKASDNEKNIDLPQTSELPDNFLHSLADTENEQIINIRNVEDICNFSEKISVDARLHQLDELYERSELDENDLCKILKSLTEDELLEIVQYTKQINSYISRENDVYDFILSEDETVSSLLDKTEENDISAQESLNLTYSRKCLLAKKKLNHIEKSFELKKDKYNHQLQNLKFELECLNLTLKDLKESKYNFDKITNVHGRHPVTKKIILQKVMKYFDDNIQNKMNLANRYKVQIQSDMMERNKIFSQIKAQEKRLASLDKTEFEEAQFEHKKSCKQLAFYKEQLGKFQTKFSPLLQSVSKMEKALIEEQDEMDNIKNSIHKLERRKEVMMTEKDRYDKKILELKAAMRKIKLDPRRHDLPEVIEYAAAKRENISLKKATNKWKKKVEFAQQEKRHLDNFSKKNMY